MSTKKLIDFKDDALVKFIQNYANNNCDGNFNEAVRLIVSDRAGIEL